MKPVHAPSPGRWWEFSAGSLTVFVLAEDPAEAHRKAEAHLRDVGVVPGGPPGLNESFERMCEFAKRGRR
jgi:hypothetical protein